MNKKEIINSFSVQAAQFSKNQVLANQDQLDVIVESANIKENEWVLDLGCGTGHLTRAIRKQTNLVAGIDLTEQMLAEATKKNQDLTPSILYVSGDGYKLPFFDNQFDVVMTRLTVHHFDQPSAILKEVQRVLKPSGRIVVADIIANEDPGKQEYHNKVEKVRDPSHVKFLSESEMRHLIKSCNFTESSVNVWKTKRTATEWIEIMGNPDNKEEVIKLLVAGIEDDKFGIQVAKEEHDVTFYHHWACIVAHKQW